MASPSYPAILIPCRPLPTPTHPLTPTAQIILHSLCLLIQDQVWSEVWGNGGCVSFSCQAESSLCELTGGWHGAPPLMKPQSCVLECSLCLRWRSKDQNVVAPIRSFCKLKDSVWGYWKRAWAFTALIILNVNLWMVEKKKCPLVHFSYITCIVLWQSPVSPSGSKAHESAEKLGQNLSQCFPLAVALSHKSTGSSRCLSMGHKYDVLLKTSNCLRQLGTVVLANFICWELFTAAD